MQPSQVKIHLSSGEKKKKLRFKRIKVRYAKVMGVTEHSDFMYSFCCLLRLLGSLKHSLMEKRGFESSPMCDLCSAMSQVTVCPESQATYLKREMITPNFKDPCVECMRQQCGTREQLYNKLYLEWCIPPASICLFTTWLCYTWGFPSCASGKEPACQCSGHKGLGSIPGLGRSPVAGRGTPFQYSCLENLLVRGAWQATVYRVTKSWT